MSIYGKGNSSPIEWWKILSRMLINVGYLKEEPILGGFGFKVSITRDGRKWLEANDKKLILSIPKEMLHFYGIVDKINEANKIDNFLKVSSEPTIVKFPKKNSIDITYDMFHNLKLSVPEIAKKRGILEQTIEDHIVKSYEDGMDINFDRFELDDKKLELIKKYVNVSKRLQYIKKKIPEETSYLQIKLTMAWIKKCIENEEVTTDKINKELSELDKELEELEEFSELSDPGELNELNELDKELGRIN